MDIYFVSSPFFLIFLPCNSAAVCFHMCIFTHLVITFPENTGSYLLMRKAAGSLWSLTPGGYTIQAETETICNSIVFCPARVSSYCPEEEPFFIPRAPCVPADT